MDNFTNKLWGYERLWHNEDFCVKEMSIDQGASCSCHIHALKQEAFFVIKGAIRLELWDKLDSVDFVQGADLFAPSDYGISLAHPTQILVVSAIFNPFIYIDNFVPHRFTGLDNNNTFLESSTHDDPSDSYRFILSRKPDNR